MLTLLETAAQAHWLEQNPDHPAARGNVLAVTPRAAYACQQLGRSYLKLEDHAQVAERFSEYASVLPTYLEWEAWLDHWAHHAIPEFGVTDFLPVRDVTFLFQLIHAEIWSAAVSLGEFLDATHPACVACWSPQISDVPWYLYPSVSALPALLPAVASMRGIEFEDLSIQAPELSPVSKTDPPPKEIKRIGRWVRQQIRASAVFSELTALRAARRGYFKRWRAETPGLLVSGYYYDIAWVADELRRKGIRVKQVADELPPARLFSQQPHLSAEFYAALAVAGEQLIREPKMWEPLDRLNLNRTTLWSKPLHFWWNRLVPELWLHFQRTRRLFAQHNYSALLTWDTTGSSLSSAAANAAATSGAPRFAYQHGSSSGIDARLWQAFLRQSDTFLTYGQGTADELHESNSGSLQTNARVVPVGSARLDALRRLHSPNVIQKRRAQLQNGDNRPIILYVPNAFATYGRAVSDLAAHPDVSYFELQQRILRLWLETPNIRLLYKDLIVANDPNRVMPDFIQKNIPNGTVTYQRLTDLMWAVDAIVVDHAITALGEVLLTSKPLVVYMPKPNAAGADAPRLLRKRATVSETCAEFEAAVRALLQTGRYPEQTTPNTEFLQRYCTHLNDGRSAERAAAAILAGLKQV